MRAGSSVLFLDLQDDIVKNSRTTSIETLGKRAGALAKLAALHGLPAFASSVGAGGAYLESVLGALPAMQPRPRTSTTAFADSGLVQAVAETGRPVLVLAGVASEIVVLRTALDAMAAGHTVHVAVDACGGVDARTEDAAWRRLSHAGAITTSVTTFAAELADDFSTELGGKTLAILYETFGG